MVKRAIKTAIELARKWSKKSPTPAPIDYGQDPSAYRWLDSLLAQVISEGPLAYYPAYAWGVLHGSHLAKSIGVNRVSVVEFGVAGGNGLVALERIAAKIEALCGIGIDVYGFDTGAGLPKPVDYRDLPNLYAPGDFLMDRTALQARLAKARLILGPVKETLATFLRTRPSPVAFVSVDLDFYSSTVEALKLFDADQTALLPRVHCYFDDILGYTFSDYNGERLAMAEFNASHAMRKITPIYGLRYFVSPRYRNDPWIESQYLTHIFDHDLYGQNDSLSRLRQLRLRE